MWLKLASATFSTNLGKMSNLSNSISIKYSASGFSYTTGSVSKDAASASLVLTLNSNYTYEHSDSNVTITGATKGATSYSSGTLTIPITPSSGSTFGASGVNSINVTVTGAVSSGGEPETPVTPTNYTFTINPTPSTATVTLTASGYTQNGNSITVANGTAVSWKVSANDYIEQNGTWTANGSNETLPVTLDKESSDPEGGGAEDISAYIQEGKSIVKAGELTDNTAFFTVVNYPVKGATYYAIPYARNAFCLTAAGGASGGILNGGGIETATIRAAGTAATMSVCFKYDDISPSEVTITETVAPAT